VNGVRRLVPLLLLPLVLTACGGDSADGGAASGGDGLAGVEVSGQAGKAPKVEVDKGTTVDSTTTEVLAQGDGAEVTQGATVLVNYVAVNAKTGNTFANTYESGQPQTFTLDGAQGLPPGIIDSLVGSHGGDRVVSAVPPSDLFGPQGNPQVKVGGKDTVVFVFDVEEASDPKPLEGIEAGTGSLPASFPQLQLDDDGTPTGFTADKSTVPAPKELHVHTLVEGDGPPVQTGDLLTAHYLGQIYPDGKIFDQSYSRGEPATFQVGVGALIPGWDKALVGVPKGSRLVLMVPPKEGYGSQGNPSGGIKGTDTLIFVVDVLGVS
jgi:peptidylprolyl isomerase